MYWIDEFNDICYKSSIDRCYFLIQWSDCEAHWSFYEDWDGLKKSQRECAKMNQISEKYRILHNIPDFSLDNSD